MEEILKSALKENEQLLWSGRPESFDTLDATHKHSFIVKSITAAIVAVIAEVLYLWLAKKNGANIMPLVMVLIALAAAFSPICVWLDASRLRKSVLYGVTDKRLILVRDGVKGVEFEKIDAAAFKTDADGHTTLLCGRRALKAKPSAWRASTLVGQSAYEEICDSFAFYALPADDSLKSTLKEHLPLMA